MTETQFYDWLTGGGAQDLAIVVEELAALGEGWCVIGGIAVNAYAAEPVTTTDVDFAVAPGLIEPLVARLKARGFQAKAFPYTTNVVGASRVSVQFTTSAEYAEFPARAEARSLLGLPLRVASLADTLAGKAMAWSAPERRPSKRLKDLSDMARILEAHPEAERLVPEAVLRKIRDLG